MTFLAICCFALVAWTVVVTGQYNPETAAKNVSFVFIDDSKTVLNLNFSLSSVKAVDLAKAAQEKKVKAVEAVADKAEESRKSTLRTITNPANETHVLCKCMCDLNVTAEEMLTAMQFIVDRRKDGYEGSSSVATPPPITTTPVPKPTPVPWR